MSLTDLFKQEIVIVDDYLRNLFAGGKWPSSSMNRLFESMKYSLDNGGKRFRPVLCLLTAEMLGVGKERVLPFAAAVECVHTYSLIHDDLPLMDNDDERRGQPTNHIVYGEAMALLAGDGLSTAAFSTIAENYSSDPGVGLELVRVLAQAAGPLGMVGGQAIDIEALGGKVLTVDELTLTHKLKTGALIASAVEGAAVVAKVDAEDRAHLREFGEKLGLAFQLADDILDYDKNNPEASGFPSLMGLEETKKALTQLTEEMQSSLVAYGEKAHKLGSLSQYNLNRTV
ncbi:MAG: polyprenyl synthetase family protein [Pseudobdellovibrionaceae bacterium]|nr:polyprenyl synthetase family protein [Bdellovibrionales bacterium]USN46672.1 MAG: polyprenyl synthetase family protein [Pseudobdellovibrionaceae bacterium]